MPHRYFFFGGVEPQTSTRVAESGIQDGQFVVHTLLIIVLIDIIGLIDIYQLGIQDGQSFVLEKRKFKQYIICVGEKKNHRKIQLVIG